MEKKSALMLGASGLVGRHCLDFLLESRSYETVTALARRPLSREHEKLDVRLIDFEELEASAPRLTAADVFCCLGTTMKKAGSREAFRKVDFLYPLEIARIARRNGAGRYFLITSIGSDSRSPFFYPRVKGELEEAVQHLGYEGVFIFRPSMLLGNREEFRPGEEIGMKVGRLTSFAMIGPLRKYRPIEAEAVARAMVRVAEGGLCGVHVFESDRIQEIALGKA